MLSIQLVVRTSNKNFILDVGIEKEIDGMEPDSEPFGSGRPSIGLKYCRIDMLTPPSTATCALTS